MLVNAYKLLYGSTSFLCYYQLLTSTASNVPPSFMCSCQLNSGGNDTTSTLDPPPLPTMSPVLPVLLYQLTGCVVMMPRLQPNLQRHPYTRTHTQSSLFIQSSSPPLSTHPRFFHFAPQTMYITISGSAPKIFLISESFLAPYSIESCASLHVHFGRRSSVDGRCS
jgi:hypothetical protein